MTTQDVYLWRPHFAGGCDLPHVVVGVCVLDLALPAQVVVWAHAALVPGPVDRAPAAAAGYTLVQFSR